MGWARVRDDASGGGSLGSGGIVGMGASGVCFCDVQACGPFSGGVVVVDVGAGDCAAAYAGGDAGGVKVRYVSGGEDAVFYGDGGGWWWRGEGEFHPAVPAKRSDNCTICQIVATTPNAVPIKAIGDVPGIAGDSSAGQALWGGAFLCDTILPESGSSESVIR